MTVGFLSSLVASRTGYYYYFSYPRGIFKITAVSACLDGIAPFFWHVKAIDAILHAVKTWLNVITFRKKYATLKWGGVRIWGTKSSKNYF